MKSTLGLFASIATIFVVDSAMAEGAGGRWAVAGNVDGKNFTLDCRFAETGQNLSGACIDGPTGDAKVEGGRSHALLEGQAVGDNVTWTYQSSYLFIQFNVRYAGVREGDHMSGTIAAAGKTGTFTATRAEP
jgi:hypothetical protein